MMGKHKKNNNKISPAKLDDHHSAYLKEYCKKILELIEYGWPKLTQEEAIQAFNEFLQAVNHYKKLLENPVEEFTGCRNLLAAAYALCHYIAAYKLLGLIEENYAVYCFEKIEIGNNDILKGFAKYFGQVYIDVLALSYSSIVEENSSQKSIELLAKAFEILCKIDKALDANMRLYAYSITAELAALVFAKVTYALNFTNKNIGQASRQISEVNIPITNTENNILAPVQNNVRVFGCDYNEFSKKVIDICKKSIDLLTEKGKLTNAEQVVESVIGCSSYMLFMLDHGLNIFKKYQYFPVLNITGDVNKFIADHKLHFSKCNMAEIIKDLQEFPDQFPLYTIKPASDNKFTNNNGRKALYIVAALLGYIKILDSAILAIKLSEECLPIYDLTIIKQAKVWLMEKLWAIQIILKLIDIPHQPQCFALPKKQELIQLDTVTSTILRNIHNEETKINNAVEQKRLQSEEACQQLLQEFEEKKRLEEVAKRHLLSESYDKSAAKADKFNKQQQNFRDCLTRADGKLVKKDWSATVNILKSLVQNNITNFTTEGTNCLTELLNMINKCLKLANNHGSEEYIKRFKQLLASVNNELLSRTIKSKAIAQDESDAFNLQVLQDVIINQEEDLTKQHTINADMLLDEKIIIAHELFAIADKQNFDFESVNEDNVKTENKGLIQAAPQNILRQKVFFAYPIALIKLIKMLDEHGFYVRVVGGAVRDFLENKPQNIMDYDLVLVSKKLEYIPRSTFESLISQLLHAYKIKQAGVVLRIILDGNISVDLKQVYYSLFYHESAEKEYKLSNILHADATHRNSTINAVYHDPITGDLYDFFNGQYDLQHHIVNAIGSITPTAFLKNTRDAIRHNYFFSKHTSLAMQEFDCKSLATMHNKLRFLEITKILFSGHASKIWSALKTRGALPHLLPCIKDFIVRADYTNLLDYSFRKLDKRIADNRAFSYSLYFAILFWPLFEANLPENKRSISVAEFNQLFKTLMQNLTQEIYLPFAVRQRMRMIWSLHLMSEKYLVISDKVNKLIIWHQMFQLGYLFTENFQLARDSYSLTTIANYKPKFAIADIIRQVITDNQVKIDLRGNFIGLCWPENYTNNLLGGIEELKKQLAAWLNTTLGSQYHMLYEAKASRITIVTSLELADSLYKDMLKLKQISDKKTYDSEFPALVKC